MKISIITIVYNNVKDIEKTILSVLDQKIKDLEYIIIDGGSSDGTVDIIKKYQGQLTAFVSEKDHGIVDAFNKGIKKASGDIIGLVNAGDFLEIGALKKVTKAFEKNSPDIIYGNIQYWENGEKKYIYKADHTLLPKFMSINHPAVFIKRFIYNQYGLFDDTYKLAMDYDLLLRLYTKNVTFAYIDTILSNMTHGGVSDINWRLAYHESFSIRKKYLGNNLSLYLSYLGQIGKRYASNTISALGLEGIKILYRKHYSTIKKEKS